MGVLVLFYILIFVIFFLIALSVAQIKLAGMKVKDFWSFVEANQILDKLYLFAKKYQNLDVKEQLIFLKEAERVFDAFDKVPNVLWEEDYQKYMEVLNTYKDISNNLGEENVKLYQSDGKTEITDKNRDKRYKQK